MGKTIRTKTRRREANLGIAFAKGFIAAIASELLLLSAAAAAASAGVIAQSIMHVIAVMCAALSAFTGALVCGKSAPKLSLPLAIGVGAAALAINFLLGLLLEEGGGFTFIMPAAFMAGAAAGGILSVMGKPGKKHAKPPVLLSLHK